MSPKYFIYSIEMNGVCVYALLIQTPDMRYENIVW